LIIIGIVFAFVVKNPGYSSANEQKNKGLGGGCFLLACGSKDPGPILVKGDIRILPGGG